MTSVRSADKHDASRRHCIVKMKFKVTNWREYEVGLRRRGSLTLWLTPEALSTGLHRAERHAVVSGLTLISPSRRP
jgi:hypothetical protein